jgi:hypothetical protein
MLIIVYASAYASENIIGEKMEISDEEESCIIEVIGVPSGSEDRENVTEVKWQITDKTGYAPKVQTFKKKFKVQ